MSTQIPKVTPKVFISYSWTNEAHTDWVSDLGTRLMSDGIEVVLDQWSLEDGQDVHAFMEKMVTDPTIKKVIIVSDSQYETKANGRKGGVGTESQIISKEVYEKVDQNKFVPVVRERDTDGKPCLPVFLRTRKYIDFSNLETESDAYDQLVRNIFERPLKPKPTLGQPPSELFNDTISIVMAAQTGRRFRELVTTGKGNPSAAFDDFVEKFLLDFEALRISYTNDEPSWCRKLLENIEKATAHRDVWIDVVKTGIMHVRDDWFVSSLLRFLERLLAFRNRPTQAGVFVVCSEDNFKFLLYEMFLYAVAICVKSRRFEMARELMDSSYFTSSDAMDSRNRDAFVFTEFNSPTESLDTSCGKVGNSRRVSVTADLIHERAKRHEVQFHDLLQADVLCCLGSVAQEPYKRWRPHCLVHGHSVRKLELFSKASTLTGFEPLRIILGVKDKQTLYQEIATGESGRLLRLEIFARYFNLGELLNLDNIGRK